MSDGMPVLKVLVVVSCYYACTVWACGGLNIWIQDQRNELPPAASKYQMSYGFVTQHRLPASIAGWHAPKCWDVIPRIQPQSFTSPQKLKEIWS